MFSHPSFLSHFASTFTLLIITTRCSCYTFCLRHCSFRFDSSQSSPHVIYTWLPKMIATCFAYSVYVSEYCQQIVNFCANHYRGRHSVYARANGQSIPCIHRFTYFTLCAPYLFITSSSFSNPPIIGPFKVVSIPILDTHPRMVPCTQCEFSIPSFCERPVKSLKTNARPVLRSLYSSLHLYVLYFGLCFQQHQRNACCSSIITLPHVYFRPPNLKELHFCLFCYWLPLQSCYMYISIQV